MRVGYDCGEGSEIVLVVDLDLAPKQKSLETKEEMGDMYVKMPTRSVFISEESSVSAFFSEPERGYDTSWKVRSGHASQAKAWRAEMASVCSQCAFAVVTLSRIQHGCAFMLSYESKRCWAAKRGGHWVP